MGFANAASNGAKSQAVLAGESSDGASARDSVYGSTGFSGDSALDGVRSSRLVRAFSLASLASLTGLATTAFAPDSVHRVCVHLFATNYFFRDFFSDFASNEKWKKSFAIVCKSLI